MRTLLHMQSDDSQRRVWSETEGNIRDEYKNMSRHPERDTLDEHPIIQ